MRFESYSSMDNSLIGPQLLKVAEAKAEILREQYSPDLKPFMDENVYGRAAVFNDLKRVQAQSAIFAKNDNPKEIEAKRLSDVFEAFFVDAANTQEWFGHKSKIMRTTRFDDYFNKVDVMGTFEDDESRFGHLAINADLTFGYDAVGKKVDDIIHDIDQQKMSRVRYFHSDKMGYTGQLKDIPKTVIGLDKEHLPDFVRLWTHDQSNPDIINMRNIMLTQLVTQLKFFTQYADKKHGNSLIRSKYGHTLKIVQGIYNTARINERDVPTDSISTHLKSL